MRSRELSPRFRVVDAPVPPDARTLVVLPSHAFGDGEHETTRMCVQAIGALAPSPPFRVLDVGSGTGILSIAAAKLGGTAVGVEIDEAANEAARANARASGVGPAVRFGTAWPEGAFELVVANILRGVLVELADKIVGRAATRGVLVLSGLVSTDVPALVAVYAPRLGGARPEIFERAEWRTLVWGLSGAVR